MKYRKGLIINNTCNMCGNSKMKIYRIKRYKDSKGTNVFIWCECEECGSVDDFMKEKV